MRSVLVSVTLVLLAGCGGGEAGSVPSGGTATLAALCPQVHLAIDELVVSSPAAQRRFVAELERLAEAGTAESRVALEPLLAASRALQAAGTGPGYVTALQGIHPAQVAVDGACVEAGSPILHDGPH